MEDGTGGRRKEGRGLSLGGVLGRFVVDLCREETMEDWVEGKTGRNETVSSG